MVVRFAAIFISFAVSLILRASGWPSDAGS
jgi:hypothetical protein